MAFTIGIRVMRVWVDSCAPGVLGWTPPLEAHFVPESRDLAGRGHRNNYYY